MTYLAILFSLIGGYDVCFLCEMPVDVKFEPCGHALMCNQCAERAKKCPTCKVIGVYYIIVHCQGKDKVGKEVVSWVERHVCLRGNPFSSLL